MPRTCFSNALRIVCGTVLAWPAATCSTRWLLGSRRLVVICFPVEFSADEKRAAEAAICKTYSTWRDPGDGLFCVPLAWCFSGVARSRRDNLRRSADELRADLAGAEKALIEFGEATWTKDGSKVDHMLYAGSNLDKAQAVFAEAIKHRPRIRLTIRQRSLVLEQWPAPR